MQTVYRDGGLMSPQCVRVGMHTATPATGWRRRSGAGLTPRPSVKSRAGSCCTLETRKLGKAIVIKISEMYFILKLLVS